MKTKLYFFASIALLSLGCGRSSEPGSGATNTTPIGSETAQAPEMGYQPEIDEQKGDLPIELMPFIGKGYKVESYEKGDLNRDGLIDYLLILDRIGPLSDDEPDEKQLQVHLILRQKDNTLKIHSSNANLLDPGVFLSYTENEEEIPFAGDGFAISYFSIGGSVFGSYTDTELRFRFSSKDNQWYLDKWVETSGASSPAAAIGTLIAQAQMENPDLTEEQLDSLDTVYRSQVSFEPKTTVKTAKEFGTISFKNFRKDMLESME
jgi:hypothetical protein